MMLQLVVVLALATCCSGLLPIRAFGLKMTSSSSGSSGVGLNIDPFISMEDYKTRGNEFRLHDHTQIYSSGKPQSKNGVIIVPDTLGWNTGRVRNLADFLGEQEMYAVIPNFSSKGIEGKTESFMDSSGIGDWYKSRTFDGNIKPVIKSLIVFMKEQGVEKISLLGFAWGTWVVVNLLASDMAEEFYCAALSSPSMDLEEKIYGGSLPELMSRVKRPLLLMPTHGSNSNYQSYLKLLKSKLPTSDVIDYQDIEANFLLRGDSDNTPIRQAIHKSMNDIVVFFQKHYSMKKQDLAHGLEEEQGFGPESVKKEMKTTAGDKGKGVGDEFQNSVEKTHDDAGKAIEKAGKNIGEKTAEAGEQIGKSTKKMGEKIKESTSQQKSD